MIGEARFAGTVYGFVRLLPSGVAQARDGRIFDSRIEIAADDLREAVGILRAHSPTIIFICSRRASSDLWSRWMSSTRNSAPLFRSRRRTQLQWRARIVFHEQLPAASGVSDSQ